MGVCGLELEEQYDSLRQLSAQKNENEGVKKEFTGLEEDGVIWKLVGPVMVRQDREEAMANVDKRLEYISEEIERCEKLITSLQGDYEKKRETLDKIQAEAQAQAQ